MIVFVRKGYTVYRLNNLVLVLIGLNIAFVINGFLCKFLWFLVASRNGEMHVYNVCENIFK